MERPHTTLNRPRHRLVGSLVTAVVLAVGTLPAAGAAQELDTEFGVGGVLRTNFGGTYDWAYAVALQPDGKIVAAGVSDVSGSRTTEQVPHW